jgi:hypothetical protein
MDKLVLASLAFLRAVPKLIRFIGINSREMDYVTVQLVRQRVIVGLSECGLHALPSPSS